MAKVSGIFIVCFLWTFFIRLGVLGHDMMVCQAMSDAFAGVNTASCKETGERILALEEQVRELQSIVSSRNITRQTRFEGIPRDCSEIRNNGVSVDGVYMISPDGRCPFRVFCDISAGGWTLLHRRLDGSVNFYRTWNEYVTGFGDVSDEHWLGLDKIHRLTNIGTELKIEMENYEGQHLNAHYKSFAVHDVTTQYRMHVDAFDYEGNLKELLSYHNDQKFSTYDRDHTSGCCKQLGGSGWWYKSCWHFNLNGVYGLKSGGGVAYYDSKPRYVQHASMKIRRRDGVCKEDTDDM